MNAYPLAAKAGRSAVQRRTDLIGWSFILPNVIGFLIFTLLPLGFSMVLGFAEWDSANAIEWVGLQNYVKLWSDKYFSVSIKNTLYYTLATVPITMALALLLAVTLNSSIRGRNAFRLIYFFPYVVSTMIVCIVWNILFSPTNGPVNSLLSALGVAKPPRWSADINWAMPTVIGCGVWKQVGYYMIIYLAGLQGIPSELYEAAGIEGANGWNKFRYITLPGLRSVTFFVAIMLTIGGFNVFDQVYLLTSGGPGRSSYVVVYYMYEKAFLSFKFGYASAMGTILFLIILAVIIVQFKFSDRFAE